MEWWWWRVGNSGGGASNDYGKWWCSHVNEEPWGYRPDWKVEKRSRHGVGGVAPIKMATVERWWW